MSDARTEGIESDADGAYSPNTLTDFKGFVAVGAGGGTGRTGDGKMLPFEVDNRFFAGKFVGKDGKVHEGTFGFF